VRVRFAIQIRPVLIGAVLLSVVSSMVWIMPWTGPVSSYIETAHYAMFFVVGILIARELPSLSSRFKQLSHRARMLFVAVALTCFVYGQHAILTFARQSGHPIEADGITEWIRALGAAGLIIASLNAESIRRVLLSPLIQSLGKMSYSIYLLHMIVMLFLVHTLYTRMPLPLIFAISFVCTLALSWISYTRIEVPFNTLGHRLTRRSMSPDPIGPTAVSREIACGIEEEVVTASESANLN
jgi:peptidoglycan/LPS O-acetylase OafA/YrhL